MRKIMNLTFESSLANLCEVNQSFDCGVIRIAYVGENRNRTYISKETFERALPTIYNCPVVCNYDIETDTIGGHDIDIVSDANGDIRIINATSPIGCIPESAKVWFEKSADENGVEREYLYAEALLWKRQPAYKKIKLDGITNQSMEIAVTEGESVGDLYKINSFEFTAFTAIGVEPCFEGAALQVFSQQSYKEQLSEMMNDLKAYFNLVNTPAGDDNTHPQNYMKGETETLNDKIELAEKYGIDVESLDFSIDDFTIEELTEKFEAMQTSENVETEETAEPPVEADAVSEGSVPEVAEENFELNSNLREELGRVIREMKTIDRWGESVPYWLMDFDPDTMEVFVEDPCDGLIYSMKYAMDGDAVTVDHDSKKRVKLAFVDFVDGDSEPETDRAKFFELLDKKIEGISDLQEKINELTNTLNVVDSELEALRQFKMDVEKADKEEAINAVFARFDDISDVDAFKELREHALDFDPEALEEKCFAIRGKYGMNMNFSLDNKTTPRIRIEKTIDSPRPYGGIVEKYLGDID